MNTIAKKFADIASRTTRPNPNAIGPAASNAKVEYFSSKSKHDTNIAMTTKSDTPRTDAVIFDIKENHTDHLNQVTK